MNLYVYTGAPDLAACTATTAADLSAMVSALANPGTAANAATLARIATSFPQLVLGDSEPLNVYFYSGAATAESWSGNAAYTLAAQLGILTPDGSEFLAAGSDFEVVANGWSGRMALTTTALVNAMQRYPFAGTVNPVLGVVLQLIVTDPDGNRETYAIPSLRVVGRVSAATTTTPSPAANYLTAAEIAAAYVARSAPTLTATSSAAGTTTFTPPSTQKDSLAVLTVTGSGSTTRTVVLAATGRVDGDTLRLRLVLPATAGIVVDVRDATEGGTQLFSLTTDDSGDSAVLEFYHTGSAWARWSYRYPAG